MRARGDPNALISVVASAATAAVALTVGSAIHHVAARPGAFAAFLAVTVFLQLASVEVYNRGSISFAGTGFLALGFTFGPGAAMAVAALMGGVNLVRRRGKLNRGVFDAAQFTLATGAGTAVYTALGHGIGTVWRFGPALAAAGAFMLLNIGLLTVAMSLAEGASPYAIWKERFRWFTPYHLASGLLALAISLSYGKMGVEGMLAFSLPPVMMMISIRQYLNRTRDAVEKVRAANEDLRAANLELAERNEDLQALFQFAGGLAARAHDRAALAGYAEDELSRLTGTRVDVALGETEGGIALKAGGARIGALHLERTRSFENERWNRLRDAIVPQLATAIESAGLVEKVRQRHLETIAALARSMEAKDYYTGGHTERVADVAVALARRLGYSGEGLDAIQIGALLHDIGKIGVPERILHKPGPLDDDEWRVMKEHPLISEYILSDVDLNPIVRQIARSSHERIDGTGYPDGLAGNAIPLPARIVLVADAFDALTSDRPYRAARTVAAAMEELRANAGTQFCVTVMEAMEAVYREQPQLLGGAVLRAIPGAAA